MAFKIIPDDESDEERAARLARNAESKRQGAFEWAQEIKVGEALDDLCRRIGGIVSTCKKLNLSQDEIEELVVIIIRACAHIQDHRPRLRDDPAGPTGENWIARSNHVARRTNQAPDAIRAEHRRMKRYREIVDSFTGKAREAVEQYERVANYLRVRISRERREKRAASGKPFPDLPYSIGQIPDE